jgi:hypothetical protein
MVVFTVDCPYPSTGSEVEDLLRVVEGSKVQVVVGDMQAHGVLHVLALLLDVIVGDEVPALLELVISAVVLEDVVAHARGQRRGGGRVRVRLVPFD